MIKKETIEKILESYPGREGLLIVHLHISPANKISLFADRMEGITIDECVNISRHIEQHLDRDQEDFELIVSSPGLDMPFLIHEQYVKNVGKKVKVRLTDKKEMKGLLREVTDEGIVLEEEEKKKKKKNSAPKEGPGGPRRHHLPFTQIQQTKLIIEF